MGVLVMDEAFKARLLAVGGAAELRDEAGRPLGRAALDPADPDRPESLVPDLTDEEYARATDPNRPTYTTEEVLAEARRRRSC